MTCEVVECTGEAKDTLLFIHGWPDSGKLWAPQVEALKKNYRCLVLTLPNYAGNSAAGNGDWGVSTKILAD